MFIRIKLLNFLCYPVSRFPNKHWFFRLFPALALFYEQHIDKVEHGALGGMMLTGETRPTPGGGICPSTILYTTHLMWSDLWWNSGLRTERRATNRFRHCSVKIRLKLMSVLCRSFLEPNTVYCQWKDGTVGPTDCKMQRNTQIWSVCKVYSY